MLTQTLTVKIDQATNIQLTALSSRLKVDKSKLVRQAVSRLVSDASPNAGQSLINMAKEAKKHPYKAPHDIIENLDKYLYGQSKNSI